MEYVVRFVFLLVVLTGYLLALSRFVRVRSAFLPVVALSCLTLVVFVGGLAGVLNAACYALAFGGVTLAVLLLVPRSERVASLRVLRQPSVVFFLLMAVVNALLFSNATLGHYDDFSHWGSIVADMFDAQGFPGDESRVGRIGLFVNYPPATASFVYFSNVLVGYTEGHAVVSQNLLLLAGTSSLFSGLGKCFRKTEAAMYGGIAFVSFFFIVNDNGLAQFQTLLIDSVMGVFVVAGVLIVILEHRDVRRAVCTSLPVVLMFSMMKDNGKVYFVLVLALLAILFIRNVLKAEPEKRRAELLRGCLYLLLPCVTFLLLSLAWKLHTEIAYSVGDESAKFAFSLGMLFSADGAETLFIAGRVIGEAFFTDVQRIGVFWGLNLASLVGIAFLRAKHRPAPFLAMCFLAANGAVVLTCIALVAFYAFLMPPEESLRSLAGFYRYYGTSLLVFSCLQLWGLTYEAYRCVAVCPLATKEMVSVRCVSAVSLAALLVLLVPNLSSFAGGRGAEHLGVDRIVGPVYDSQRQPISSALDAAKPYVPAGQSIAVYFGSDMQVDYRWYLSMYEMNGDVFYLADDIGQETTLDVMSRSDWLICLGVGSELFAAGLTADGVDLTPAAAGGLYLVGRGDGA